MLTIEKIQTRLKEIDREKNDDERAHTWEKELWHDTLRHVAIHSSDAEAKAFAKEALKSMDIEFSRWFA